MNKNKQTNDSQANKQTKQIDRRKNNQNQSRKIYKTNKSNKEIKQNISHLAVKRHEYTAIIWGRRITRSRHDYRWCHLKVPNPRKNRLNLALFYRQDLRATTLAKP